MFTHDAAPRLRRRPAQRSAQLLGHLLGHLLGRFLLALGAAGSLVLGAALASPVAAVPPDSWETQPDVSPLAFLLVLLIIPLGIAAVLVLLTLLPSLASDRGYEPGQSWRSDAEWFGGPTKGVKSAADVTPEQVESRSKDTGGTSAGW